MLLTRRRSTHSRQLPSGLRTRTMGLVTSLRERTATPVLKSMATCSCKNSCCRGLKRLAPGRRGSSASSSSWMRIGSTLAGGSAPSSSRQTSAKVSMMLCKRESMAGVAPAAAARANIVSTAMAVSAALSASVVGPHSSSKVCMASSSVSYSESESTKPGMLAYSSSSPVVAASVGAVVRSVVAAGEAGAVVLTRSSCSWRCRRAWEGAALISETPSSSSLSTTCCAVGTPRALSSGWPSRHTSLSPGTT